MYTQYYNARFIDRGVILSMTELYVDMTTNRICPPPSNPALVTRRVNLRQQYLAPGYIDIQNNGVFGCNFSISDDGELTILFKRRFNDAMEKYLTTGVTSMCPTITLSLPHVYSELLPVYKSSYTTSRTDSLGAHLEGPFISPYKKGCHPCDALQHNAAHGKMLAVYGVENKQSARDWLKNICIITAAPEIPGVLECISLLKKYGIIFSIGHTNATLVQLYKAVESGATMITHLYNAMPQPHHRETGVVGLISDPCIINPYFGLICDGQHIALSMAVIAYRANPSKCVLTTDAMHLLGLPDGSYSWGHQQIIKTGPILYLEGTTTLAGAATTLAECVRNLVNWLGISLPEAIKLCTNNAAESLNLGHDRGFLTYGCTADFVVLDNEGYVTRVFKLNMEHGSCDINPRTHRRVAALL